MIIFDTDVFLAWTSGNMSLLSQETRAFIDEALQKKFAGISAISVYEAGLCAKNQRLVLSVPIANWFGAIEKIENFKIFAVDKEICLSAAELPGNFSEDVATRILVATARKHGCPVLTANRDILSYRYVLARDPMDTALPAT